MALGNLVVEISANVARFQSDMGKVAAIADANMRRVQQASDAAAAAVKSAFAGIAAGLTADAFISSIKGAIDMADHLNDLSKSTGITVETLGGLGFAASQAGSDLDGVAKAVGKLNLKIADAAAGGKESSKLFDALGISVTDLNGKVKAGDAVFAEIAKKFEGYADGPKKAALGNAAFGKSYQQIIPLLDDGAEALQKNIDYYNRFGGVTTDVAKKADEFNDTLTKISLVSSSFTRSLAAELLPSLQAVADEMLRVKEETSGASLLVSAFRTVFETVVVVGANVAFVLAGVGREIGAIAAQAAALARLDFKGFTAISDAVKEDGVRARKELDAFVDRVMQVGKAKKEAEGTAGGGKPKPEAPGLPTNDPKTQAPFAAFLADLDRMIEKTGQGEYAMLRLKAAQIAATDPASDLAEAYQRIAKVQAGDSQKVLDNYIIRLYQQANAFAFQANLIGKSAEEQDRLTFALQARLAAEDAINAAMRSSRPLTEEATQQLRQQTEESIRYTEMVRRKRDETLRSSSFGAARALREYTENAGNAAKNTETLITGSLDRLEDAIVEFAKTGKLSFRDLFAFMAEEFLRQQIRMQVSGAANGINWGGLSKFFTTGASSSAATEIAGNDIALGYANGLSYVPYDGYKAILHEGERVVSKQENDGGSAGGAVFDFSGATYHIGQGVNRGEMAAAVSEANAKTEAKIRRSMRQGTFA